MDLGENDREILNLLEKKKNLVDIAFETGMVEFHVASRMLELHEQGLIHVDQIPDGISYEQQVEALQEFVREGVAFYNATRYREARAAFEKQQRDGSWLAENSSESRVGRVYATSMAVLSLSVKYHYLPIYQK